MRTPRQVAWILILCGLMVEAPSIPAAEAKKPKSVDPAPPESVTDTKGDDKPRKVEILVKNRDFKKEKDGALRVTYDDLDLLKVLNMEPVTADAVERMPVWLKNLDGKKIRLRGFMYPPFQESGIAQFVLARDNQICCFGRNPKIYDLVEVTMKEGVTTHYIQNRPFDVVGQFSIKLTAIEETGEIVQLYQLQDALVIEK